MLEKLHNIHQGKRLFIIGTGPSLKEAHLDMVKAEITWGVNHLCEHTDFVPTYYAISDFTLDYSYQVIEKLQRALGNKKVEAAYYSMNEFTHPVDVPGWIHIPRLGRSDLCVHQGHMEGLGNEFEHIHPAHDVVGEIPLQLGLWMGFRYICLIGADYGMNGHFYDNEARFSGGASKKQGRVLTSFKMASQFIREVGGKLVCCTENSELITKAHLPYQRLEDALAYR